MKLSKKKETELADAVYDKVMDARVKIARLMQDYKATGKAVDDVLYKLTIDAPSAAIDVFEEQLTQSPKP